MDSNSPGVFFTEVMKKTQSVKKSPLELFKQKCIIIQKYFYGTLAFLTQLDTMQIRASLYNVTFPHFQGCVLSAFSLSTFPSSVLLLIFLW